MLKPGRKWVQSENLNPEVVENIYRDLVNYFVTEEGKKWKNNRENVKQFIFFFIIIFSASASNCQ